LIPAVTGVDDAHDGLVRRIRGIAMPDTGQQRTGQDEQTTKGTYPWRVLLSFHEPPPLVSRLFVNRQ